MYEGEKNHKNIIQGWKGGFKWMSGWEIDMM